MITLQNITMKPKLIMLFLLVGLIPLSLVGWWSSHVATDELMAKSYGELKAVRGIKKAQLEELFAERREDLDVLVAYVDVLRDEAMKKLRAVTELKTNEITRLFQGWEEDVLDVSSDPGVIAGIQDLSSEFLALGAHQARALYLGQDAENIGDGSDYSAAHGEQHGFFSGYIAIHRYQDALLIDPAGNVVYSTRKTEFFGTNLISGAYQNSHLAELHQQLKNSPQGTIYIADIDQHDGEMTMFIGVPIYDKTVYTGILAYQVPFDQLNTIAQQRQGMGETGETYLVGKHEDSLAFRSDMTTMGAGEYTVGYDITDITMQYIENALSGNEGQDVYTDSAGKLIISAYKPLQIHNLKWACISKIDLEEAITHKELDRQTDFFTQYIEKYGHYDLFLIHPKGTIFYTVTHESDYETNILDGEYADSGLGKLVRDVLQQKQFGFADFKPYEPSHNEPAAFIAQPVLHGNEVELIVALQLSIEQINAIMQQREGMGETGETYLVGSDQLMRSDSFRDPVNHTIRTSFANPGRGSVKTRAVTKALSLKTGEEILENYRGNAVLSAYTPVKIGGTIWALLAEINKDEIEEPIRQFVTSIAIAGIVMTAILIGVALGLAGGIAAPLVTGVRVANQVAEGNLNVDVEITTRDEVGQMLGAVKKMIAYIQEVSNVAERVADKDLHVEVISKSEEDVLNHSLQKMVANLRKMVAENEQSMAEIARQNDAMKEQSWLKDGISELNTALSGEHSLRDMCNHAVSVIARYIHAGQGVLYAYDPEKELLTLQGTYAFTERDSVSNHYALSEGVIGQVALERSPILLKHLTREEGLITTGTMSEAPLNTYTFPLMYHNELHGVVELASFEPFDQKQQEFFKQASSTIATALFSTLQKERVQELLELAQQKAEEAERAKEDAQKREQDAQAANARLEEQQQQLQQQNEEFQQMNAHLEEQQQQLEQQREEMRQQKAELEWAKARLEQA